ncbi:MAG: WbqC family protein [Elusimicrobia bacterium]|jgi:prolyl-tRNA synthetase|nr:WbqC family protein [Elusimicrobiota bacterium]
MKIAIHQPQYMPWLGYLDKINRADKFVFLDDVQYKKREFQNRNRIKTPDGAMWLTVPVLTKGKYFQKIKEVIINNDANWQNDHIKAIKHNYRKTDNFKEYFSEIKEVLSRKWSCLGALNIAVVKTLKTIFKIDTPYILSSKLKIKSSSTQRIIDICKELNADSYISGRGGKDYMDEEKFKQENIELIYQNFKVLPYKQNFGEFISNLTAVDYLFNCGNDFFI